MDTEYVDVRCPGDFARLFYKIKLTGEKPKYTQDNLVEIACGDCARAARKNGEHVKQVLHYFNFIGECVKTIRIDS